MDNLGKAHLIIMWTVGPEDVAEGDRLFESHAQWMQDHPREGDTALISYSISKGPELASPFDPASEPTGNTIYVLDEVYASPEGVAAHWKAAAETWPDLAAILQWGADKRVATLHCGTFIHSLW